MPPPLVWTFPASSPTRITWTIAIRTISVTDIGANFGVPLSLADDDQPEFRFGGAIATGKDFTGLGAEPVVGSHSHPRRRYDTGCPPRRRPSTRLLGAPLRRRSICRRPNRQAERTRAPTGGRRRPTGFTGTKFLGFTAEALGPFDDARAGGDGNEHYRPTPGRYLSGDEPRVPNACHPRQYEDRAVFRTQGVHAHRVCGSHGGGRAGPAGCLREPSEPSARTSALAKQRDRRAPGHGRGPTAPGSAAPDRKSTALALRRIGGTPLGTLVSGCHGVSACPGLSDRLRSEPRRARPRFHPAHLANHGSFLRLDPGRFMHRGRTSSPFFAATAAPQCQPPAGSPAETFSSSRRSRCRWCC